MIRIRVSHVNMSVGIDGHADDSKACGAITMLMKAASIPAEHSYFAPGLSMVIFDKEYERDFCALVYGLECVAAKEGWTLERVAKLDGPKQITEAL